MVAIVIGATGLVGFELTNQLLSNEQFEKVKVFARRSLYIKHEKLEENLIDFNYPDQWKFWVTGDVLFSALGTTLKQAGSKAAQFKVDYKYQYNFAKAAAENGVSNYVLISSAYASPTSKIFYSRVKGILEKDVKNLSFRYITILQPGQLTGDRKEKRFLEQISIPVLNLLRRIPGLSSLKPIHAATVAKAMINAATHHPAPINVYTLKEVFELATLDKNQAAS